MFTRPRPKFTVADAEAVAITEIKLAAIAVRIGMPRPSVSSGTRKTPPPRPRSGPCARWSGLSNSGSHTATASRGHAGFGDSLEQHPAVTGPALGAGCAIVTCLAWGVADYLAARITRRVGETGALLRIQLVGVPVLLLAWAVLRAPWPDTGALLWITPAACCFVVGYLAFFHGLRVGAVSLVSPISSAGAAIPVLVGIGFFGEAASGARLGGMGLTLIGLGVLLADPGTIGALAPAGRRRGIQAGLVTLLAWGSGTALLLPVVRTAGAFVPVATLRLEVLAIVGAWWLIERARSSEAPTPSASILRVSEPPGRFWGVVVAASVLDLTAFFAYGVALRDAPATVAAPIASAYPLVTILIARHHLQERLARREWVGVGLTLAGVALLGTGCCETQ